MTSSPIPVSSLIARSCLIGMNLTNACSQFLDAISYHRKPSLAQTIPTASRRCRTFGDGLRGADRGCSINSTSPIGAAAYPCECCFIEYTVRLLLLPTGRVSFQS